MTDQNKKVTWYMEYTNYSYFPCTVLSNSKTHSGVFDARCSAYQTHLSSYHKSNNHCQFVFNSMLTWISKSALDGFQPANVVIIGHTAIQVRQRIVTDTAIADVRLAANKVTAVVRRSDVTDATKAKVGCGSVAKTASPNSCRCRRWVFTGETTMTAIPSDTGRRQGRGRMECRRSMRQLSAGQFVT